jgi:phage shock protein E
MNTVKHACALALAFILANGNAGFAAFADKALVKQKIAAGALILDVRTAEEFAAEHYRGAINIPLAALRGRLAELGSKTRPIVVYCRTGRRSEMARTILLENGFIDVINAGGIADMNSLDR